MIVQGNRFIILPIRCHVDVILFGHEGDLLRIQPCESEHSNLLYDVAPVAGSACEIGQRNKPKHDG